MAVRSCELHQRPRGVAGGPLHEDVAPVGEHEVHAGRLVVSGELDGARLRHGHGPVESTGEEHDAQRGAQVEQLYFGRTARVGMGRAG